jgi:hypothetical protein
MPYNESNEMFGVEMPLKIAYREHRQAVNPDQCSISAGHSLLAQILLKQPTKDARVEFSTRSFGSGITRR